MFIINISILDPNHNFVGEHSTEKIKSTVMNSTFLQASVSLEKNNWFFFCKKVTSLKFTCEPNLILKCSRDVHDLFKFLIILRCSTHHGELEL